MTLLWPMGLGLLLAWIFWPRHGLRAILSGWLEARRRREIEDALKHLLSREQQGRHASPESLAGTLQISRAAALRLIARMEAQGLLQTRGRELHLTPDGERWAIHVVRAHRLLERYLADEARLPLEKVHREAERREHRLTPADLDRMAAALGHPRFDPHGDPIPTPGAPPLPDRGTPITAWPTDTPARVVHLEDEPPLAYAQLLAAGVRLGQVVRVLESAPQRLVLSDGEQEIRLAPAVAANVYVEPVPEAVPRPADAIPLAQLPDGQEALVLALDPAVQGFTRRRLLDMGLTPGARVRPELRPFFGDPRAYRVRGTLIALRRDQAAAILVRPLAPTSEEAHDHAL